LEPRPACTLPSGDESAMNRADVWKFSGSSAVSSRNGLQRIHAAFVAMLGAERQIVAAPGRFGVFAGRSRPEIATAYYREFQDSRKLVNKAKKRGRSTDVCAPALCAADMPVLGNLQEETLSYLPRSLDR
jgi:hypothetical protein